MSHQDQISSNSEMLWRKPWEFLRQGEVAQGLQILRAEYQSKPNSAREILRLGIGYMWSEKYESAATHFTAATRRERNGENDFAFAGVAEWQLGKFSVAVQHWRKGLKAQYAAGSRVCSMTARFLVLASALQPELFFEDDAENLLLDAIERIDSSKWSGLLGRYLLGRIERSEVERWIDSRDQDVEVRIPLIWETDFYSAAKRLKRVEVDIDTFRTLMRPLADAATSRSTDAATFAQLIRRPEYFFARTEAAKARIC